MSDPGDAVAARCRDCLREFYVTDEPAGCPYCGEADVGTGYNVAVRPR